MTGWILLAVLELIAPENGAVVPLLKDAQKAYLAGPRAERIMRMDNPADRKRLFAAGATQRPVRLAWTGSTNAVYLVSVLCGRDQRSQSAVVSNRTEVYVTNLELGAHYDWSVRPVGETDTCEGTFTTEDRPPRLLRAEGVANFRDLGGWKTVEGRRVLENMVFRSAGLRDSSKSKGGFFGGSMEVGGRRVTDGGLATLREEFAIKTDLELRTPQETAGMNGTLLGAGVTWVNVPFVAYDFIDNAVRGREPFAKIFSYFTKRENYPILIHCSGGRDRTGTLAFLLNGLLGVGEDDLCRDWEATVFSDTGAKFTSDRLQRLLDYLKKMPGETINQRIESYVRGCGISTDEIAAFRAIMLQPRD